MKYPNHETLDALWKNQDSDDPKFYPEYLRPVMFDQFCHVYLYRPELMTDPGLRDFWGREFAPFWEAVWNTPSMLGGQFFNFTWTFDRRTGELQQAAVGQRTVLVGGPVMMVLPHKSETHTSGYPVPRPPAAPFNETCHDWRAERVSVEEYDGGVQVVTEGRYREAEGRFTFRIGGAGHARLHYRFVCRTEVDPREIGAVFYLPKSCDTLHWKRRAQWTTYPDDHIGRPEGVDVERISRLSAGTR